MWALSGASSIACTFLLFDKPGGNLQEESRHGRGAKAAPFNG
jgi:hypothetical protein